MIIVVVDSIVISAPSTRRRIRLNEGNIKRCKKKEAATKPSRLWQYDMKLEELKKRKSRLGITATFMERGCFSDHVRV